MLAVEGLGKRFERRWVLRSLTFRLAPGDGLVVTGRNGVGKSTLLRIIAGLVRPTEGAITLPEGDYRQEIGFYALDQNLYPHLTATEHLNLTADLRGCDDRADELLGTVGLADAAEVRAGRMSTGMRARLKLALAVQARPKLLLLDEPGAGLDEAGRNLVGRVCAEQREHGVLVVATNDAEERRLGNLELELKG